MPKYFEFKIAGYYLYFTSHCIIEPVHAHASDSKLTESNSAKLWVYENGDTKVSDFGNVSQHDMKIIREYIKNNIIAIKDKWEDFAGHVEFKQN